jgi:hypothetical protein
MLGGLLLALRREGLTWLKVGTDVGWVLALAGQNSHQLLQIRLLIRIDPKWIEIFRIKNQNQNRSSSFFKSRGTDPDVMFFIKKK